MEEKNVQYINQETYSKMIQELGNTIGNLNLELALSRAQYQEVIIYAQNLENKLNSLEKPVEVEAKEENKNE